MRTILGLPGNLLSEAMRVTHAETKTAVVALARLSYFQNTGEAFIGDQNTRSTRSGTTLWIIERTTS
jgi:hypothetical protein